MEWLGTQRYQASPAKSRGAAEEPATISIVALLALCHPWQLSGTVPPLVLRVAVIMPPSNPLALAREPAIVNIPNAAWVLVMLHAPVRPSSGVGPGVAAATLAPAPLAASVRAATSRGVRALRSMLPSLSGPIRPGDGSWGQSIEADIAMLGRIACGRHRG